MIISNLNLTTMIKHCILVALLLGCTCLQFTLAFLSPKPPPIPLILQHDHGITVTNPKISTSRHNSKLISFPPATRIINTKPTISTHYASRSTTKTALQLSNTNPEYYFGVGTHFLVRIVFLRALALLYMVAFTIAYRQNKALIGDDGITPARYLLKDAKSRGETKRKRRQIWWEYQKHTYWDQTPLDILSTITTSTTSTTNPILHFLPIPSSSIIKEYYDKPLQFLFYTLQRTKLGRYIGYTLNNSILFQNIREILWDRTDSNHNTRPFISLFWLLPTKQWESNINPWLDRFALLGLLLSGVMFITGAANIPLLFTLWMCQRTFMSIGGPWYGYGWETQLNELTFHALFLVPFLSLNPIPYLNPVPMVVVWAMRWFLFRIMMGAGLIKLRSGDDKWKIKNLSTMQYFYETQPVPNPFSRYFHKMPVVWHKFEVLMNHFVELIAPWLLIMPFIGRKARITGAMIQIIFQCLIISSGNLSYLNWLTMIPALFCLDDAFVSKIFTNEYIANASIAAYTDHTVNGLMMMGRYCRTFFNVLFVFLISSLSIPVVKNLLSKKQIMNASFDPLRLVNTYGAFGTVNEVREELIVEGAEDFNGPWKEYEFKVKPGNINRPPRWISPYHYRLDWQMWIASCTGSIERNPWMFNFLLKLLKQDGQVLSLLENDPWKIEGKKPKYIRVEKYQYRFNKSTKNDGESNNYWVRERIGRFFPKQGVCTKEMLESIVNRN